MPGEFSIRPVAQDAIVTCDPTQSASHGQAAAAALSHLHQSTGPSPASLGQGKQANCLVRSPHSLSRGIMLQYLFVQSNIQGVSK